MNLLVLVLAAGEEPWNGMLIPTEREHHKALIRVFPELAPHPVLGKWLYLSQTRSSFEEIATAVSQRIRMAGSALWRPSQTETIAC